MTDESRSEKIRELTAFIKSHFDTSHPLTVYEVIGSAPNNEQKTGFIIESVANNLGANKVTIGSAKANERINTSDLRLTDSLMNPNFPLPRLPFSPVRETDLMKLQSPCFSADGNVPEKSARCER